MVGYPAFSPPPMVLSVLYVLHVSVSSYLRVLYVLHVGTAHGGEGRHVCASGTSTMGEGRPVCDSLCLSPWENGPSMRLMVPLLMGEWA